MDSDYDSAVARLRRRAVRGALTPSERERIRGLHDQVNRLAEDWARHQASLAVDRWQRATKNRNGGHHIEDAALPNLTVEAPPISAERADQGGRRGSGVWHHGVEQERQD